MSKGPSPPEQAARSPWAGDAPAREPALFEAILEPPRSLSPRAFRTLMIGLACLSAIPTTVLWINGAWPCAGFLGLDVVLLYFAFRTNYRHARLFERVRLTATQLGIERVWPNGHWQRWTLEPYWARVEVERAGEHDAKLAVVSRGQRVTLGSFLPPEERAAVAEALKAALAARRLPSTR